jgi:hypothetical protein
MRPQDRLASRRALARPETRLDELQLKVTESTASDRGNTIIDLPPLPRVN